MRTNGQSAGLGHDGAAALGDDGTGAVCGQAAAQEKDEPGAASHDAAHRVDNGVAGASNWLNSETIVTTADLVSQADDATIVTTVGSVSLADDATIVTTVGSVSQTDAGIGVTGDGRTTDAAGQAMTIWLTGLSGAGKSTIASMLTDRLTKLGIAAEWLDGDELRRTLGKGLGFSREDRFENIRRAVYLAEILNRHGVVTVVSLISPYAEMRDYARRTLPRFAEVYVDCPLDVCEARDVKGMYAKVRRGEIPSFTGISDPYEIPTGPEMTLNTAGQTPEESVNTLLAWLTEHASLRLNK
ncbi:MULTISPECIES: adenylyl-sulfate kinase [unclassified Paenibacillus]|uniref:adenylyl-sulfate kinase n=1 Tax=unclassified Paenibacillus TaxID=185978 RepID=UPI00240627C4|nr:MULTISPECIES: adenylyl-sulfate kinase [unclassified Paenibacillus]MDF9842154.1 adenylyl-sulfate kinase [Paenibacillus sp. PastF-2]MDF9848592.1 adenylyl-sulfate kinase [Paenibacillus sp. PastM-2]MDF9855161.1 adenylyl-sulfate kinase [Paenibacillus sp. PastF-1]MDH6480431.1 adenylyl-sulfate kinase [Paenibacillus sp. PastH-2]MDH6507859.1 adenylyl-sulfate kinase [Paenibacillus sp. PastM-3]